MATTATFNMPTHLQNIDPDHLNTSAGDLERQIKEMQIDGTSPNPRQPSSKEDQFRSLKKYLAND